MFGCGGNDIFEQDAPAPSPQPSLYGMLQLLADINAPTPEDHSGDYPPHSPTTEAALQPQNLDWNEEVEQESSSLPELEKLSRRKDTTWTPVSPLRCVSLVPSIWGAPSRGLSRSPASQSPT